MTTLYFILGGVVCLALMLWVIIYMARREAKNKYDNELLKIRAEKHKRDQDIAARNFVDDPLDKLRELAGK